MVIGLHAGKTKCRSFPKVHPPQQRHHGEHLGSQCHRLWSNGGNWNQRALQGTGATGQRWTNKHKNSEIYQFCLDNIWFKYRSTEEPVESPEVPHSELVHKCVTSTKCNFTDSGVSLCAGILSELLQRENRVLHFWTLKKRRLDQCQQYLMFQSHAQQVVKHDMLYSCLAK